ncbi:MAG: outer membrane protein transport protein [Gammaproteobacteria bacterium]|nr:outer membrane protein transport protein [Gammaproteobacteria bacterium]
MLSKSPKKIKMKLFNKSLITLSLALISTQTLAAGFQLNSQSATGLGRAYAGDAVIADNASAMARNPASMALFKTTELSLGAIILDTDVTLKNSEFTFFNGTDYTTVDLADVNDISGTNVAPNIFIVHPIDEQWTVGFGAYSNFATTTKYDSDFAASIFGGTTVVSSVNLQSSVAYRINEQVSIGVGLDVILASGELHRETETGAGTYTALDIEADGIGLGWHVGVVYELDANNRFGLSYRYSPTIATDGDFTIANMQFDNDTLDIPLPSMAEFSGFHQLTAQTAVHYSAQFIQWSNFDVLATDQFVGPGGVIKEYNWRNTWHLSVGATHKLNKQWTIRTGYMYDMGAVDQIKSIAIPDSDRQWFSAGFSYTMASNSTIDFGLTYLMGKDTQVEEQQLSSSGALLAQVNATTRANALLYGLQYNYQF